MRKIILSFGFLSLLVLSACANQTLTNTGRIANADNLTEVDLGEVSKNKKIEEYIAPDAAQRSFSNIVLGPIRYDMDADSEKELKEDDRFKLAKYFHDELREELEDYPLLVKSDEIPENSYYVDVTVTGINGSAAWLNILLTATVALPFDTGGISAEVSIYDYDTKEEVAAFRAFREGTMFHLLGGATEYGHAEGGIQLYAERVRLLLEQFQCQGCQFKDK